jgi:ADP-heptose:LPS heptosyltransferase
LRRLIIRPGAIGDTILSFPAMEHLQPDEVWVRSELAPLVRFTPQVRSIASTGLNLLGVADVEPPPELIRRLRAFDDIVSWYGTNRSEFRDAVARFGLPFRFLPALPADETIYAADFFARQVGAPYPAVPRIDFKQVQPHRAAVLHPFSGSIRKNWPLERFEQLAHRLSCDMPVEWAAGPDWVRFENLHELGAWLAGARVYVGNDSGVTHLAAAAGVPTVALFGPTDSRVWAPRGPRVRVIQAPTMEAIDLEATLLAIRELLRE